MKSVETAKFYVDLNLVGSSGWMKSAVTMFRTYRYRCEVRT